MKRPVVIGLLVAALLLVLAGIGAVAFFALRNSDLSVFDVPMVSATAEESKTLKVDTKKPVTLEVDDDAGDVSIVGGNVKTVEVKIVKTGNAPTQARAEEDLKNIKYEIKQNGNEITLLYKLNGTETSHIDTVDFIVTVPTETTVKVENSFGTVDASDIKGKVDINGDFGDVTVKNIEGALLVESSSGKINATSINAGNENVTVEADFGDITLEKISGGDVTANSNSGVITFTDVRAAGTVFIKTDFGNTFYENGSAETLSLETNSGKTSVTKVNVRKELTVDNDFGDIELTQALAGSYDLHTNSGEITIDGAEGSVKAYTDFGNIEVQNAESVDLDLKTNSGTIDFSGSLGEGPHNVQSDFGNINLALPSDSNLNVDLSTDFGNISSDIPITVTLSGDLQEGQQTGEMNEGGGLLTAQTNSGNISITAIK